MRAIRVRAAGAVLLLLGGSVAVAGSLAAPAGAATFNVINANDSGAGSLRQALTDAAGIAGPNTVVVQAGLGTIVLDSEISWSSSAAVTITGNGATVNLNGQPRGLVDAAGKGVTVDGLTLTGGSGTAPHDAGAIVSEGGTMTVSNCTISNNHLTATAGDVAGGLLSEGGAVSITGCTITGNTATGVNDAAGGVVSEGGAVIVASSTISHNTGTTSGGDAGGGVLSEGGPVTGRTPHIDCNSATTSGDGSDAGGGIASEGGNVTTNDGSIVGNTASATGGGTATGSVLIKGATASLGNTTVSDSTATCTAPVTTTTTAPATTTTTAAPAAAQAVTATPALTG